jgi:hypothetical protein
MEPSIPYQHYLTFINKINEMPNDSKYLENVINLAKAKINYLQVEISLLEDKMLNVELYDLTEKSQKRLYIFLKYILKFVQIEVYLIVDDSASWYCDLNKTEDLALNLNTICEKSGELNFKAEIVTLSKKAQQICIEILGPPSQSDNGIKCWKLSCGR